MHILITGATGYIGKRLIPILLKQGHHLICTYRRKEKILEEHNTKSIEWIHYDFLVDTPNKIEGIQCDIAYFLIHAMSSRNKDFGALELQMAHKFIDLASKLSVQKIIYLSGIVNNEQELSPHFKSRYAVEKCLNQGPIPTITLRAGIIVGSGSASFEIIRDLVEKLPVMVTPRWLYTKCQPIAIRDVLYYLTKIIDVSFEKSTYFDIGGPEIFTYKQMLLQYAEARNLNRYILTLPVMTPRLSSYWLYFVTSTSYNLAVNLVKSMKIDVICKKRDIENIVPLKRLSYKEAIERALFHFEEDVVISKWSDSHLQYNIDKTIQAVKKDEVYGGFIQHFVKEIPEKDIEYILHRIWSIGGENGWYYGTRLWKLRAFFDKLVGGVGYRKRNNKTKIQEGEALDFWRVVEASRSLRRLTLLAEMKLPGEAILRLGITKSENRYFFEQNAIFYPHGLLGRMYWWILYPIHIIIFKGMAKKLCKNKKVYE
ncbi:SDR family oxidoreductase [Halosquirtibacter laminarini]|uniref:SDR family oxidoreductase n=1 Tax=Halosquirtibacter laminarini TaxID=3374600 RepID=A0AC61NB77_9BACT|nr:SDR family oxidoreductase [Prolixibacteraceae bacterium]